MGEWKYKVVNNIFYQLQRAEVNSGFPFLVITGSHYITDRFYNYSINWIIYPQVIEDVLLIHNNSEFIFCLKQKTGDRGVVSISEQAIQQAAFATEYTS